MTTTMVWALTINGFAQRNDDFFRVADEYNESRDAMTAWTINNNGIGQSEAPVGGGLLILGIACAGYAIAKRRRNKKGIALSLALVMMLGMTQCKKNLDTISDVAANGVYITLNVDGGEKVGVNPTGGSDYATVTWEKGDVIYVGNNGAYCGLLKYDGSKFGGTINPTSADDADYLHFYFMGNKGPESEPASGVSITDQSDKYPVVSYGRSTSLYDAGTTAYSTTLYNKCAIVKFITTDINADITIKGMKNTVAVDFSKNKGAGAMVNPYTYSKTGDGDITLHRESNTVRWAILLPQDEVTTATATASADYASKSAFTVPEIAENMYSDAGVSITMTQNGLLSGLFSVSDTKQVRFAQGNLQATTTDLGTSWTWAFAANQWDYIGGGTYNGSQPKTGNNYINGNGTVSENGTIDLFGWVGASNNTWTGAAMYGISNSSKTNNASTYGNVANEHLKSDWGNTIGDGWYTLTVEEWEWVLGAYDKESSNVPGTTCRTSSTVGGIENGRYATATVAGVCGVILFPDSYTHPEGVTAPANVNAKKGDYTANNYDAVDWGKMETAGCVFLPAAGRRYSGKNVEYAGNDGYYWTNSSFDLVDYAKYLGVSSGKPSHNSAFWRDEGMSVRLVKDKE